MDANNDNQAVKQMSTEDEHIHLPPPSWAPIVLALGMAGAGFGVVLSPILLLCGVIGIVAGLGIWISDEIRNATPAGASGANQSHQHTT
ncbi:MAG TPA: hypothetical protein VGK87_12410 [Anaerolineae bacterium]